MAEKKGEPELEYVDIITLEFDDGTKMDCEIMGIFDYDGKDYMALIPEDGSDDVYIYGYKEAEEEGQFDLEDIKDDALFQKVAREFESIMESGDEEEE